MKTNKNIVDKHKIIDSINKFVTKLRKANNIKITWKYKTK